MKAFGKIESQFWESPDIQSLSIEAKLLATYLLTCKHGNMVGVFRLPAGYIAGDLGWDIETVSRTLHELTTTRFVSVREKSDYLCINRFNKYNDTSNADQLSARIKELKKLPEQVPDLTEILDALELKATAYKESEVLLAELESIRERIVGSSSESRLERKRDREIESKRSNTTIVPSDESTPPQSNGDDVTDAFERWWQQYPRREGKKGHKGQSLSRYKVRLKEFTHEQMLMSVMRYARFCDAKDKTNTELVMQTTTYLNDPDCINNSWTVNDEARQQPDPIAEAQRKNAAIINGEYPDTDSGRAPCGGNVFEHDQYAGEEVDQTLRGDGRRRSLGEVSKTPPPASNPVGP